MIGKLNDYQSKRNFDVSAEPRDDIAIAKSAYPRFVIHRHDARQLHYDLRLEVDGIFRSWAVPRGPSFDPDVKRLAVEVEDHPLAYGDFEGVIPNGQYGGGCVMIWDRGFWAPVDGECGADCLRRGELKFVARGSKFKGGWVLVRISNDRRNTSIRNSWLLIKHRDDWARRGSAADILDHSTSVATGRSMNKIEAGTTAALKSFMAAGNVIDFDRSSNLTLSNPEKQLWPRFERKAVTKQLLANYLQATGNWMLRHLSYRPCSIVRAPDGIKHKTFFQRHASNGLPDQLAFAVTGEDKPYLAINDMDELAAAAQISVVEFHPWNCAPNAPLTPGRLVFDLDPGPAVPFAQVVEAARELRDRLDQLGLIAFCKTTGGKGLHVVTPLRTDDKCTWQQAKMFAQTVCLQMAQDSSSRYLTNMSKRLRMKRIYLDYLRNDHKATAVAPLSPRAKAGAPVSMPLSWSQVRSSLDPLRYTIHSVPRLLDRTTAWDDYFESQRSLVKAIKRLIGNYDGSRFQNVDRI